MSPISNHFLSIGNGVYIQLVDDFNYDNDGPVTPDNAHIWVDIYGNTHYRDPRDGLPPLFFIDEYNVRTYYW
jgi:hypothetical protein